MLFVDGNTAHQAVIPFRPSDTQVFDFATILPSKIFGVLGYCFHLKFNTTTPMTEFLSEITCLLLSKFQNMVKVNPTHKRGCHCSSAAEEQVGSSGKCPTCARQPPSWLPDGVDDTPPPSTSQESHTPLGSAVNDKHIISPALQQMLSQCITQVTSAFLDQQRQLMATFAENILSTQGPLVITLVSKNIWSSISPGKQCSW